MLPIRIQLSIYIPNASAQVRPPRRYLANAYSPCSPETIVEHLKNCLTISLLPEKIIEKPLQYIIHNSVRQIMRSRRDCRDAKSAASPAPGAFIRIVDNGERCIGGLELCNEVPKFASSFCNSGTELLWVYWSLFDGYAEDGVSVGDAVKDDCVSGRRGIEDVGELKNTMIAAGLA